MSPKRTMPPSFDHIAYNVGRVNTSGKAGNGKWKDDTITLHLVPHTHDDTGWLKTVDQYHYGANDSIQHAGTQYILDTVVNALLEDPERRFIYVEMAFFTRWWNEQSEDRKDQVRSLVQQGRLEFINGGWCMHDEAATHVYDMIDQMTTGHRFLLQEFGIRPTVGWQIDPFGHSSTNSRIFSEMGFNSWFVARIDYQDYALRMNQSNMETVWRSSASLGKESDILFGVFIGHYCWPSGFNFENGDEPVMDDPRLFNVNVHRRASELVADAKSRAQHLSTPNVMYTMGCDFNYQDANINYKNMDKLIRYINAHSDEFGAKAKYSTPSVYTKALHEHGNTYTVKTDDFFPYADCPHCMWSGYFTSRAAFKGYERERSALFRAAHTLVTSGRWQLGSEFDYSRELEKLQWMFDAMGVAQHHDAVSGTEKQHVVDDYSLRLYIGSTACYETISDVLEQISGANGELYVCPQRNASICDPMKETFSATPSTSSSIHVLIYNALSLPIPLTYLSLPAPSPPAGYIYTATSPQGTPVAVDIIAPVGETENVSVVLPVSLPGMGYAVYTVALTENSEKEPVVDVVEFPRSDDVVLTSNTVEVTISGETGRISAVKRLDLGISANVDVDIRWYNASTGNADSGQSSGAYIFRPNSSETFSAISDPSVSFPTVTVQRMGLGSRAVISFNETNAVQIVSVWDDVEYVEIENIVGPIDISDNWGKEYIVRYNSSTIASNDLWYTDSNGLEFIQRQRNYRETWNYTVYEPVAGNYVPVNTAAYLKDENVQLSILTDRSQGCASLASGSLEFMVQRRLTHDDSRGVGEALNETYGAQVRPVHRLILSTPSTAMAEVRSHMQLMSQPVEPLFSQEDIATMQWSSLNDNAEKLRTSALPPNVRLINYQTLSDDGEILLRLQHMYAVDEDPILSKSVQVNLDLIFPSNVDILSVTETALTANQLKSDVKRYEWKTQSTAADDYVENVRVSNGGSSNVVTMKAMEIKTFLVRAALV